MNAGDVVSSVFAGALIGLLIGMELPHAKSNDGAATHQVVTIGVVGSCWDDPKRMDVLTANGELGYDIHSPNALLIAAAPDLYEACAAMASCAGNGSASFNTARKMARAALAKARGGKKVEEPNARP